MIKVNCYRLVLLPAILAMAFPFKTWAADPNPETSNWQKIGESEVSTTYIDTGSNRDMGNSIRRISTVINFKKRFGKAMSSLTVNEFDCKNRSVRYVKGEGFSEAYGQGSLIGTTLPEDIGMEPGKFLPIDIKNPLLRHQYDLACGK